MHIHLLRRGLLAARRRAAPVRERRLFLRSRSHLIVIVSVREVLRDVNVLSVGEIAEKYPLIQTHDLFGGIHIPSDGYANAVDITQALAKGAKRRGARIFTDTKVEAILRDGDEVTGVRTAEGEIRSRYVVICGGM